MVNAERDSIRTGNIVRQYSIITKRILDAVELGEYEAQISRPTDQEVRAFESEGYIFISDTDANWRIGW